MKFPPRSLSVPLMAGFVLSAIGPTQRSKTDSKPDAAATISAVYPDDQMGILIKDLAWTSISQTMPSKSKTKRGLAASLSYGAVPAAIVAEYAGSHAQIQVSERQPAICICHLLSLPADPVLVRLHAKKDMRELDGGRLPVLGAKLAEAKQSDMIPTDVTHPEQNVWLVRPREALPEGEYALMLGTQNVNIFPFGISASPAPKRTSSEKQ